MLVAAALSTKLSGPFLPVLIVLGIVVIRGSKALVFDDTSVAACRADGLAQAGIILLQKYEEIGQSFVDREGLTGRRFQVLVNNIMPRLMGGNVAVGRQIL